MIYRYKLARTQRTSNINSKVIEGVKLRKHSWLYSMEQLNFGNFKDLVIEEFGESKETLLQLDKEKKKDYYESQKKIGKKIIADKKKDIQAFVNNLSIAELNKKTEYQLKSILHYLGFKKHEFLHLGKAYLINLILLEKEVSDENDEKDSKKVK